MTKDMEGALNAGGEKSHAAEVELLEDYRSLCGDSENLRWLMREVESKIGERVLEVGTGIGGWTNRLAGKELLVSIDVSTYRLGVASDTCKNPNVVFANADICSERAVALASYGFDTVLCINTLEHIEEDGKALRNMFRVLSSGGRLVLVVPAIGFLYGSLDRRYGHHRRYHKGKLRRAMGEAGFEVESIRYRNLLGAVGWFLYGKVFRAQGPPVRSFTLYDRMVRAYAVLDRILGPPFGLSLVAVGCKR
jgi:SAM-dependent methyltransferase